jgi:two-component system nitrate/nitrite response regulator NarL
MHTRLFVVVAITAWADLLRERFQRDDEFEIVGVAADGERAERQLARLDRSPDIVVLDVDARLALRAATAVHHRDAAVGLVAVGLDDNPTQVLSWALAGATGLVARTASLGELLGALAAVARGEAPCSPTISGALLRGVGSHENSLLPGNSKIQLTDREHEVARLLADGFSNKEIAMRLQIEPGTVKSHVHSVIRKLGVSRRAQVAGKLARGA